MKISDNVVLRSPLIRISIASAFPLFLLCAITYYATSLGHLGLTLTAEAAKGRVVVSASGGPTAAVPVGFKLDAIVNSENEYLYVTNELLIEEPDTLPTRSQMLDVMRQSGAIYDALSDGPVTFIERDEGETTRRFEIQAEPSRPLRSLSVEFWVQVGVGLMAAIVGIWVWSLNPASTSTIAVLISGIGLQLSASAAAVYSTRELAIPADDFYILHRINWCGTMTFGGGMVCLFTTFPRKIGGWKTLYTTAPIILAVWVLIIQPLIEAGAAAYFSVTLVFVVICALITVQFYLSRQHLADRQALKMMGFATLVGTGSFVLTRALPAIFEIKSPITQGQSFVLIFIIYAAISFSVHRFRVFDLPVWSINFLFYFLGACGLVALDAMLVLWFSFGRAPALGLSVLAIGMLYLPLRDWIRAKTYLKPRKKFGDQLSAANFVARAFDNKERRERWHAVLTEMYEPLSISGATGSDHTEIKILHSGEAIFVPAPIDGLEAVELAYANRGRRLFNSQDRNDLTEFCKIVIELVHGQEAYAIGMEHERARIAQDLHDNMSISLLSALHSRNPEDKNSRLQELLSELRTIINNTRTGDAPLDVALGDVRISALDLFDALGIDLDWPLHKSQTKNVSSEHSHIIRSFIREALNNVQHHAEASKIAVNVRIEQNEIIATVEDNGIGFKSLIDESVRDKLDTSHNGLRNFKNRAVALDGSFDLSQSSMGGACVTLRFPLNAANAAGTA
ncbi:ATP-binding protein [Phaeobacter sp. JH20_09]|uniref:sensor histidine kinase n=1 Tax=unclassified Phaeobacter TaxID=2621772 RepID=UPI003A866629